MNKYLHTVASVRCHYLGVNVFMQIIASFSLIILSKVTVMFPLLHDMKFVATDGCVLHLSCFASILKEEQTHRLHQTVICLKVPFVWDMTQCRMVQS